MILESLWHWKGRLDRESILKGLLDFSLLDVVSEKMAKKIIMLINHIWCVTFITRKPKVVYFSLSVQGAASGNSGIFTTYACYVPPLKIDLIFKNK